LCREAICRHVVREARCDICRTWRHSLRWFSKWWAQYRENQRMDFADG
jgi:hypothetical protein